VLWWCAHAPPTLTRNRALRLMWESSDVTDASGDDSEDALIKLAFAKNRTAQRKLWLAVRLAQAHCACGVTACAT
jgi:hypothetical protein